MKFTQRTVKTSEIPGFDELLRTIELCREASKNESSKALQFFDSAAVLLAKKTISILTISDHNTKGMAGPSRNGTPFYAFMKAKGQSKKSSETATGSFGIGKFAPYAVSGLRSVFVSTVYKDQAGQLVRLTQGKSILMSHDDSKGNRRQGIGFWGVKDKCQPIDNPNAKIPKWITRGGESLTEDDIGTTLTVLAFDAAKGWEENVAASVAENFFGAINSGNLEVDIQNEKFYLSKNTIGAFFGDLKIKEAIQDQKNEPEQFENASEYLRCYLSNEGVHVEESQSLHLGLCSLRIIVAEGLPKRVCVLRNGMFISDSLSLPGLKNFSDFKEFVAVFECKDPAGIELLRAMEPPRHDDFQPERLPTKEDQQKGKKALEYMARWIREMLKRHAKDPVSDKTTLDELKDFFADDTDEGNGKPAEEINPLGEIVIRARPTPPKLPRPAEVPEGPGPGTAAAGGEGGGGSDGAGGGDSEGGGAGSSDGGHGQGTNRSGVGLVNLRAVTTSSKSRRISFTPTHTGTILVCVYEAGADSDYELPIKECSQGDLRKGSLAIEVEAGKRTSVDIGFKASFDGALKVTAYEI